MKQELAAVFALMKLLVTKLHVQKTELFIEKLLVALKEKFQDHWYPDNPSKGQAYRCIRVNLSNSQDPELLRACKESGVQFCELGLPPVLTLWVDPGEVACRLDSRMFSSRATSAIWMILTTVTTKSGKKGGRASVLDKRCLPLVKHVQPPSTNILQQGSPRM
uniref:B-cell translocation gene 3 n=1 Tax=Hippocampus comes TaxID=109280 RepID=A0A3Q3E9T9_HIPCM